MNISFIGYGNMAKAIVQGLKQQRQFSLKASAPSLSIGIDPEGLKTHYDNKEVIKNADVLILAVKPGKMATVLQEIAPVLPAHCLLISVAAGLSLEWFTKYINPKQAIIRSMPNTPATIALAATPLFANANVLPEQKHNAELIFSSIGITTWAHNEEDMDTFTAVSGSGPAYVFLFIGALIDSAVQLGLNELQAKLLVLQTIEGTVQLAKSSTLTMSELKEKVTSPGGTTAAALKILEPQFSKLIFSAIAAAKARAKELEIHA